MWRMTVIMLISVALAACIPIPIPLPQHEPDEFDRAEWLIDIGKSTKAEVIEILGKPQWEDPRDGNLYYSGEVAGALAVCVLMAPDSRSGEIIGLPWCYFRPDQDWWIKVVFDENEVVTSVETKMEKEAEAAIREMRPAYLRHKAEVGDRAASFALASEFDDPSYLKALAEEGDREAAFHLASELHDTASLKVLAQEGDIEASKELVKLTGETTKALRELAESGDLAAAILLARHANELGPLKSLAESGNYEAAYALYERARVQKEPSQFTAAWRWLCLSANAGYSKAQTEVGYWHRSQPWKDWEGWNEEELNPLRKVGVQSDDRIAYMWYTLAVSTGGESAQHARDYYFGDQLTEAEIAQAEQMARDWKPGDCPSAEHRLAPAGET